MEPLISTQNHHHQKIADELGHFLADSYVLYLKTQNYHWNVAGPNFYALHLLFEAQYKELADAIDIIAERIRALGCHTPASFAEYGKLSSIKEETHTVSAEEMIKKLMKDNETLSHQANLILAKAEKNNDQGTMDMLIQRIREHDKAAWMLRSSIEKK